MDASAEIIDFVATAVVVKSMDFLVEQTRDIGQSLTRRTVPL